MRKFRKIFNRSLKLVLEKFLTDNKMLGDKNFFKMKFKVENGDNKCLSKSLSGRVIDERVSNAVLAREELCGNDIIAATKKKRKNYTSRN